MRRSNKEIKQHVADKNAQTLVPVPRAFPDTLYGISSATKIRDLAGIASISLFSGNMRRAAYSEAEKRLQGLVQKHVAGKANPRMADFAKDITEFQVDQKMDLRFIYPVMRPSVTNKTKLLSAQQNLQRVLNKIAQEMKFNSHRKNAADLQEKFAKEQNYLEREIANRTAMQEILNQVAMPLPFKQFMATVSQLNDQQKQALVRMTV